MYRALPFGLCTAPAVFTSMVNFPVRIARQAGINCLAYLDDFAVWASSKQVCGGCKVPYEPPSKAGIPYQFHQVMSNTQPGNSMAWSTMGWPEIKNPSSSRKGRQNSSPIQTSHNAGLDREETMGEVPRIPSLCRTGFSTSNPEEKVIGPSYVALGNCGRLFSVGILNSNPRMVVSEQGSGELVAIATKPSQSTDLDRCLPGRLGGTPCSRSMGGRFLDSAGKQATHKLVGTEGSLPHFGQQLGSKGGQCPALLGQYHHCACLGQQGLYR